MMTLMRQPCARAFVSTRTRQLHHWRGLNGRPTSAVPRRDVLSAGRSTAAASTSQLHSDTAWRQQGGLDVSPMDDGGYGRPTVQWYPGHIAKAERQLSETLKAVDVVVEVRDARACKATAHPRVGEWCAGRPRIVVLTHMDMVPKAAAASWRTAYERLGAERWDEAPINTQVANQAQQARDTRVQYETGSGISRGGRKKQGQPPLTATATNVPRTGGREVPGGRGTSTKSNNVTPVEDVLFVDAKQGQGIHALHRAIFRAGAHVQERRERRGLNPRALRVGIIGYPNVGKVRDKRAGGTHTDHTSTINVVVVAVRKNCLNVEKRL
jgi:hypothetical protein